jgi:hypothetical protein
MTQQQQSDFLGDDKINTLFIIYQKIPLFRLTGSISLIEWGICERRISDIDIVVDTFDEIQDISNVFPVEFDFDYTDEMEHAALLKSIGHEQEPLTFALRPLPNRAYFKIGEVNCCVFLGKGQEVKSCQIGGIDFLVSHPKYAIEAKKRYLKDLEHIESKMPLTEFQKAKRTKHMADVLAYDLAFIQK